MRRTHLLVAAVCAAASVVTLLLSLASEDRALGLALAGILFANALVRYRLAQRS
jgi:hypothetical protein